MTGARNVIAGVRLLLRCSSGAGTSHTRTRTHTRTHTRQQRAGRGARGAGRGARDLGGRKGRDHFAVDGERVLGDVPAPKERVRRGLSTHPRTISLSLSVSVSLCLSLSLSVTLSLSLSLCLSLFLPRTPQHGARRGARRAGRGAHVTPNSRHASMRMLWIAGWCEKSVRGRRWCTCTEKRKCGRGLSTHSRPGCTAWRRGARLACAARVSAAPCGS